MVAQVWPGVEVASPATERWSAPAASEVAELRSWKEGEEREREEVKDLKVRLSVPLKELEKHKQSDQAERRADWQNF